MIIPLPFNIKSAAKSIYVICLLIVFSACYSAQAQAPVFDRKIDALMKQMTLEEKIGQLNQVAGSFATGPVTNRETNLFKSIREGTVGSVLNAKSVEHTRALQEAAMESRLKIPLLFGLDVIHGYKTTFPIPLADAASWDLGAIELAARIAAVEAAAAGLHWTFAPMVDVSRDPRWGRVMEGAGEDSYLGSLIARARVNGFQGKGLGNIDAVMACAKHFAAYGAAIGGRDYNSVDMSDRTLWETYLPPFKAAADAGVATFMNSFNDLNGVPATGNKYLQRDILKGKWNYKGFVVSDWASIKEMINHGYADSNSDAAYKAITAGSDMDMVSKLYLNNLPDLVKEGKVPQALIDDAVRRILLKKFELGLFDDPYRFCDANREKAALNNPKHRQAAREVAQKSIVLLKNEKEVLPLKPSQKIALIGPLAKSEVDMLGFWNVEWPDNSDVVTLHEALEKRMTDKSKLLYAKGCEIADTSRAGFAEAVRVAKAADVVVVYVGEKRDMSGEAKSRANITLPGVQEELVKALYATGKPMVVMIGAGRPLVFNWIAENVPSILYTWWLGSEAGNAMADVLFGDYNPSAKLPMTFPRSEGQIPLHYNYNNTGRPSPENSNKPAMYTTGYIDMVKSPQYSFGYGLSYTTFGYDNLKLSANTMTQDQTVKVEFKLTNTGKKVGEEVVQLYIRDKAASLVRPIKELKGFQKIKLKPGESKMVSFTINKEALSFYNNQLQWVAEPGMFDIMVGASAMDIKFTEALELK